MHIAFTIPWPLIYIWVGIMIGSALAIVAHEAY
jgi:hypothetical protein